MLVGLPCSLLSPEQHGVGSSWCSQCELVESDSLASSIQDALPSGPREAESGNGEFGHLSKADIIRYSSNLDDDFGGAINGVGSLFDDAGEGKGGAVDLGKEQAVENNLRCGI